MQRTTLIGRLSGPAIALRCWGGGACAEALLTPNGWPPTDALALRCWGPDAERLRALQPGALVRVRGQFTEARHPGEPLILDAAELTRWPLLPGERH